MKLSTAYRHSNSDSDFLSLQNSVKLISRDDTIEGKQLCYQITRCFHELLNLTNLCENYHRVRRYRAHLRGEADLQTAHMPIDAFQQLIQKGITPQMISQTIATQRMDFVLTSHPTQAVRTTLLRKYAHLSDLMALKERPTLTPLVKQHVEDEIERTLLAW